MSRRDRPTGIGRLVGRVAPRLPHFFGDFRLPLVLVELPERLVAEDAGQVVVERAGLLRRVVVDRECLDERYQRLLDRVIGLDKREALTHIRIHHRAVPGYELSPARVL